MPVFSALSAMENWYLSQWNSSVSFTLHQGRHSPTMEASSFPGQNIRRNSSPLRCPAPNRKPGSAYPETPFSAGKPSSLHLSVHKTIVRPLPPAFPGWYNHPKGTYAGKEVFLTASNKNCALTLNERRIIQTGITNGSTKTAIANTIGKDKSTIGKEIKRHRILKHKCGMPLA